MKLSAPVYKLKKQAKELKRSKSITMTEALDRVAKDEGFSSLNYCGEPDLDKKKSHSS